MKRNRLSSVCLNVILLIFSIATILPFLWMFASSFKSNSEISALKQHFFPQAPSLVNYQNAIEKMNFLRYFGNSLFYATAAQTS